MDLLLIVLHVKTWVSGRIMPSLALIFGGSKTGSKHHIWRIWNVLSLLWAIWCEWFRPALLTLHQQLVVIPRRFIWFSFTALVSLAAHPYRIYPLSCCLLE